MKSKNDRRDFLKAAGATLVAASMPAIAAAQVADKGEASGNDYPIYLNGCAWNRELPGNLGQACFSFDARANLGGTGFGTIRDDVYPELNSQFSIDSVSRHRKVFTFVGSIIASRTPEFIGMKVTIVAESIGDGRGKASVTV